MSSISRQALRLTSSVLRPHLERNLATSAVAANAPSDPIQKLFVDKIREYAQKKSSAGGKLVDATAKTEADLQTELDRVAKIYGGGAGIDMTKFPDFKWQDPQLQGLELK